MSKQPLVGWLRTPDAVRERCHSLLALADRNALPFFSLHPEKLETAADLVAAICRENYPDLNIPYHSRWRHFAACGIDRWAETARALGATDALELARVRADLCTVSVLLDAGAGPEWRYVEASRTTLVRSEGLAVASLDAFRAGLFSSDPSRPLRADGEALARLSEAELARALQVSGCNPIAGLEGRLALLRNLGAVLLRRPDLFGRDGRIGNLLDQWCGGTTAGAMLSLLLDALAPIWPGRLALDGENLGDVWQHPSIPNDGLVPLHKLSQWLCYSLVEVLEDAGMTVEGTEALTGLAEYRNGGLFVDLGVLRLRDPALATAGLPAGHPAIVEWRALTVALLDRLAPLVRARLRRTEAELPLACLLQGGTWDAGRRIAREHRHDGGPPIRIASDGSVF